MSHSQKVVKVAGFMLLAMLSIGMVSFSSLSSFWAQKNNAHAKASSLPYHEFADGPYKVQGNTILGADGKPYLFHGVGRDGFEFVCTGPTFIDPAHLAFMGPSSSSPGTYWWSNTVRLPLSESFWLKGSASQSCTANQYQGIIKQTVDAITALKLNVILDLQWTDAGGQAAGAGAGFELPDSDSLTFWSQAAKIYAGYSNVLFELYNEPHPPTWSCWAAGCTIQNDNTPGQPAYTYKGVGIQALVNTVRGAGANNLVLVAGLNWGFDLSQLSSFPITGSNIVYDAHPYPYAGKGPGNWDAAFGYLTAKAPVMSAENGEYDCQSTYMSQLLSYFDAHMMSWTAWAWYNIGSSNPSAGCGYPELILDFNGTPSPNMGTFIYQHLLSYAGITQQPAWTGWSEVPGNGFTLSGPATTFYQGKNYVSVRGTNNHIYVNSFNGTTWSGWSEVLGHGLTPSAPRAVAFGTTLSLFVRGTDNKIYANTLNGTTWSGWSLVPGNGSTFDTPNAVANGNNLLLFVRGTNNHLYVNSFNGTTWSGWSEVPGHGLTPDAPGATAFFNKLYLFVCGTNDRIYVNILQIPA